LGVDVVLFGCHAGEQYCFAVKIKGATLQATNQLNIDTKNLEGSSVQNKHKAKTRSQGASPGIGSSGVNSVGFT
jgi:hypothetical protein